jgi:RAD51-like protein 1
MQLTLKRPILNPSCSIEECEEFYRRTCIHCAPKPCNALSLLRSTEDISELDRNAALSRADRMRYLPTGISSLDRHLRGGVRVGTITELVGKAGVGKTQLAMQLCVMAARYGQGCVYIDTEKKLSLDRMREIASKRASTFNAVPPPHSNGDSLEGAFSYGGDEGSTNDFQLGGGDERQSSTQNGDFSSAQLQYQSPHNVFQNVTVHSPASTDELLAVMATIEDEIFLRNQEAVEPTSIKFPVRLLVLDSIAAPARRDFGSGSAPQRAAIIFQCAQTLKRLADQLHLAIVVINQVGAVGSTHEDGDPGTNRAALGTSWHHCLSTRILMEYQNSLTSAGAPVNRNGEVRQATIVKSNLTGQACVPFEVSALGVSDVSP